VLGYILLHIVAHVFADIRSLKNKTKIIIIIKKNQQKGHWRAANSRVALGLKCVDLQTVILFIAGELEQMTSKGPFQLKHFCDSMILCYLGSNEC